MKTGGPGPVARWCHAYGAGVWYAVFWVMALRILWPQARIAYQASAVFAVTALLEAAQLWRPPGLEVVRQTLVGRALLGASFDWLDYPHYAVGCALGAAFAGWIRRRARSGAQAPGGTKAREE